MDESTKTAPSEEENNTSPREKELPKLTPAEFRTYNRMAEHMDYFVRIDIWHHAWI